MSFKRIDVKEIEGFKLGNAENQFAGTGCTVIICEDGAVTGVDVRGGGPATRETDLLKSENTIEAIHAVTLSGGSAFGLEAGSGVMRYLEDMGIGHKFLDTCVPIVTQASLFDLGVGDSRIRPDRDMGYEACENAYKNIFDHGNHGAGTGATVGKFYGMERAMKSGLGTFACSDGELKVGAIAAVNAFGDIYNGNNNIIAGLLNAERDHIKGSISCLKNNVHGIAGPELPDLRDPFKEKSYEASAKEVAGKSNVVGKDETTINNDIEVESAKEELIIDNNENKNLEIAEEKVQVSEIKIEENLSDEEMGYNIPFNTTITCVITNAKLTKSQANKLASILHDGYARAIKPVHGTLDGDTIFVMTTNKIEVNYDAFAALATDIVQYSIIDAANSATDAYGLLSSRTILGK